MRGTGTAPPRPFPFRMAFTRVLKALLLPALVLSAPLLGSHPASAATCQPDPYNGVCVTPVNATVKAKTAVQRTPKTGNVMRYAAAGTTVGIVCRISSGTWDAISGGGWVDNSYVNAPATGVRVCGTPSPSPTYTPTLYPWPAQDSFVSDGHGYYQGECVSFAAWAVRTDGRAHTKSPDFMGNASAWTGAYVDATPHAGDVAQWDPGWNGAGSAGHVAYVATVNSDGSVLINEYNWGNFHRFNSRTVARSVPSRYLHF